MYVNFDTACREVDRGTGWMRGNVLRGKIKAKTRDGKPATKYSNQLLFDLDDVKACDALSTRQNRKATKASTDELLQVHCKITWPDGQTSSFLTDLSDAISFAMKGATR